MREISTSSSAALGAEAVGRDRRAEAEPPLRGQRQQAGGAEPREGRRHRQERAGPTLRASGVQLEEDRVRLLGADHRDGHDRHARLDARRGPRRRVRSAAAGSGRRTPWRRPSRLRGTRSPSVRARSSRWAFSRQARTPPTPREPGLREGQRDEPVGDEEARAPARLALDHVGDHQAVVGQQPRVVRDEEHGLVARRARSRPVTSTRHQRSQSHSSSAARARARRPGRARTRRPRPSAPPCRRCPPRGAGARRARTGPPAETRSETAASAALEPPAQLAPQAVERARRARRAPAPARGSRGSIGSLSGSAACGATTRTTSRPRGSCTRARRRPRSRARRRPPRDSAGSRRSRPAGRRSAPARDSSPRR